MLWSTYKQGFFCLQHTMKMWFCTPHIVKFDLVSSTSWNNSLVVRKVVAPNNAPDRLREIDRILGRSWSLLGCSWSCLGQEPKNLVRDRVCSVLTLFCLCFKLPMHECGSAWSLAVAGERIWVFDHHVLTCFLSFLSCCWSKRSIRGGGRRRLNQLVRDLEDEVGALESFFPNSQCSFVFLGLACEPWVANLYGGCGVLPLVAALVQVIRERTAASVKRRPIDRCGGRDKRPVG
jgi:hypothetical protein